MATLTQSCNLAQRTDVQRGDFYVAPNGDDGGLFDSAHGGPGTEARPFATLARARDAVRAKLADGISADVTVYLRGGRYEVDETVIFDERDSPPAGLHITYCAYPGETPELVGGRRVTGWTRHSGEIYKAQVAPGWVFTTLFENGVRAAQARYPNAEYNRVRKSVPAAWQTQLGFGEDDLPRLADTRQLQIYVFPGGEGGEWNWFSDILNVASVDWEQRILTLAHPARYALGAGSRYFVQGALDLLDAPGEFFLDRETATLYYWPRQTPIDAQEIVAATTRRVLAFIGRSPATPVRGISIAGVTLRVSDALEGAGSTANESSTEDDGLIVIENAAGIAVRDCRIANTGLHAVLIQGAAQECAVSGCEIADIGHTGIQINGPWLAKEMINYGHTLANNHIHHTGRVIGHGAGIQLVNSGRNTLTHHCIHHTSRYAISLKGPRPGIIVGQQVEGIAVTRANAKDFAHSRENEIAYNDLSRANLDTQDTGVFESWGSGLGNRVHHNRIHHSDIPFSFGFGLYLDDAADGFTVSHNLLHDLQQTKGLQGQLNAIFMTKGVDNVVINNVAADNFARANVETFAMADEPNERLVYERNIFYQSSLVQWYKHINWSDNRLARADYNLVFNTRMVTYQASNLLSGLEAWQKLGYDQHSEYADPLFVNAEQRDYRLRPESPARPLGIEEIAYADIGLTADFRYADPAEPPTRLFVRAGADETLITLAPGATAQLEMLARTETGFVADLSNATTRFESADPAVAVMDAQGKVTATGAGLTDIAVTATTKAGMLRTVIFISVGGF